MDKLTSHAIPTTHHEKPVYEPTDHPVEPPSFEFLSNKTTLAPATFASIAVASPNASPPTTTISKLSSFNVVYLATFTAAEVPAMQPNTAPDISPEPPG